jgi:hypothetical protein
MTLTSMMVLDLLHNSICRLKAVLFQDLFIAFSRRLSQVTSSMQFVSALQTLKTSRKITAFSRQSKLCKRSIELFADHLKLLKRAVKCAEESKDMKGEAILNATFHEWDQIIQKMKKLQAKVLASSVKKEKTPPVFMNGIKDFLEFKSGQ